MFRYPQTQLQGLLNKVLKTLNPDYFLESRNQQQHFTLQYAFTLDKRDVKAYPQDGNLFTLLLQKDGFGLFDDLNIFAATGTYAHYFHLGKKLSFGAKLKGRYTFVLESIPIGAVGVSNCVKVSPVVCLILNSVI